MSDKQRIQFDFTAEAMQRLDSLLNKTGSATKAEVLKKALRLLEWLVMELDPDQIIVIEDSEGKAIYRIPVRTLIS